MIQPLLVLALFLAPGDDPAAPAQAAPPHWAGDLNVGGNRTRGNTRTDTASVTFKAERRAEKDRWTLNAFANYGSTKDDGVKTTTTNNTGGDVKYDYFYSERAFLYGNTQAKVDHVADIHLRSIVGAGGGYQWKETDKLKWSTDVGLSYVDENFDSSEDKNFLAARLGSSLSYAVSETTTFEQTTEVLPNLERLSGTISKFDNRIKMLIGGNWNASLQYVFDIDGLASGDKKEKDHRLVLSIGWNFGS